MKWKKGPSPKDGGIYWVFFDGRHFNGRVDVFTATADPHCSGGWRDGDWCDEEGLITHYRGPLPVPDLPEMIDG